jgi:Mg2+-importing ATPase
MNPKGEYWSRSVADLFVELESRPQGLSAAEAARRAAASASSAMDGNGETGWPRLLLRQFASPLVLILVWGGMVSLILRDWVDAAIILSIVLGSAFLGFLQEYRASAAVQKLRRRLALTVQAVRDGVACTIPVSQVVPGDVIRLRAGNLVPADGVVLDATDFLVSEASLTGESFPVEKRPGVLPPETGLAGQSNCVHLGTSVRSGLATVLVVNAGRDTTFGAIAAGLEASAPESDFSRGVRQFGYLLLRVMVIMVLFVLTVNQLLGRPVIESMLYAVALAVGLSPELLPAIVSVTLSHGARAMAARGVIVRKLEAIENLGSMDVLCTDKTGTLTEGKVSLVAAVDADGKESASVRLHAYVNSVFETGIENALDAAIVAAGVASGLDTGGWHKVDEIPYDFLRKRLTIVAAAPKDASSHCIVTKGACAEVLGICSTLVHDGVEIALDAVQRARLEDYHRRMGSEGYRVLALATRCVPAKAAYGHADESGLRLEGFLLFFDPPRADAAKSIGDLAERGIRVKIISGDSRHVTAHVAAAVGLDPGAMLTGEQIAQLRDEALQHRATHTTLFAEIDPQQKERIVAALRRAGHVVGYMGDGINDAPALHAADVGISVEGAVDVARESADVVLLTNRLDVLRLGVQDGRRTFANTMKYICITTSANFGNMVSMAVATPLLPFLPLAAKQILLNNFLSDLPSIAISTDNVDAGDVAAAQRWHVEGVRRFMVVFGLLSTGFDLLTFLILLKGFGADEASFQTAWFVVSLLTELAVVLVLRTHGPAWRSRPGQMLLGATIVVGAFAVAIPFVGPLAAVFAFQPLSWQLIVTLLAVVMAYVASTEVAKRAFYRAGYDAPHRRRRH